MLVVGVLWRWLHVCVVGGVMLVVVCVVCIVECVVCCRPLMLGVVDGDWSTMCRVAVVLAVVRMCCCRVNVDVVGRLHPHASL